MTQVDQQALDRKRGKSWRDHPLVKIHPAAELFPMMSETELRDLGEDIKKNGLKSPIIFWRESRIKLSDFNNPTNYIAWDQAGPKHRREFVLARKIEIMRTQQEIGKSAYETPADDDLDIPECLRRVAP